MLVLSGGKVGQELTDRGPAARAIAEIEEFLEGHLFAWFGFGAVGGVGMARHMGIDLAICKGYGLDTEWAASRIGAWLISDERETRERARNPDDGLRALLQGRLAPQITAALQERPRNVLCWSSIEQLEALVSESKGQLQIVAPPAALKSQLDDKHVFRRALDALGIEPVPHVVCDLHAVDCRDTERLYGMPFVVQLASSAGGSGTFIISCENDLQSLQEEKDDQEVAVSEFISHISPNINAVVCDDLVLLSPPSIQLVGVPQCKDKPCAYCGSDFSAAHRLPTAAMEAIYDQTRKIGRWIAQQGFRGLWGLDFVVDGSRVYPLEVNPRLQGSTPLLGELQHLEGQVPLALAHVASFLDGGPQLLQRLAPHWEDPRPLKGAKMVLVSRETDWCVVRGAVWPGVYAWDGAQATYRRVGLTVADCQTPDEFVVTGNVPRRGTRIEGDRGLCSIQTRREVLDGVSNRLQPWAAQVCDWVYEALDLSPL
jgi:predicted ATP-grasp superfamily ATP-dependent carboligase